MYVLKKGGPQTVAELGCATGVCGEAARQQLIRLAADGLVTSTAEPRGVGRPAQVWSLTPAGNARFPDAHADLAASLIRAIREEFGEEGLDRLIDRRAAESRAAYAAALEGATSLGEKVCRLAEIRNREGYMAECRPESDGGYLLIEHHCPICVAAHACRGFCRAELETFRALFAPDANVERTGHVVHGDRRCAYRITPQPAPSDPH